MHTKPDAERSADPTVAPETMRAVVARRYGEADVIAIEEVAVPRPAAGEVLLRVETSSLNALDWHYLTGTPYLLRISNGLRRPKRTIPGADVAGTVVATGSGVTRFQPGDAVFGECPGGGCAPFVTVGAGHVVAKPASVSFEAAGASPVAGRGIASSMRRSCPTAASPISRPCPPHTVRARLEVTSSDRPIALPTSRIAMRGR